METLKITEITDAEWERFDGVDHFDTALEVLNLEAQVAELQKDKERLDWLESLRAETSFHPNMVGRITLIPDIEKADFDTPEPCTGIWTGKDLRDAIDAAMRGQQ